MTNAVYPKWKDALMLAAANSSLTASGANGMYAVLIDTGAYSYSAAHEFYSSLAGMPAAEQEVTATTVGIVAAGVIDGNNVTFPTVPAGPACEAIVLFRKNSGASGTWRLITYLDEGVNGLPVTPNGGDITINWNAGGIFRL